METVYYITPNSKKKIVHVMQTNHNKTKCGKWAVIYGTRVEGSIPEGYTLCGNCSRAKS